MRRLRALLLLSIVLLAMITYRVYAQNDWLGFMGSLTREGMVGYAEGKGSLKSVVVAKWSFKTGHSVRSSPAIADVDGDGQLEVIIGSCDDNVYCLDSPESSSLPLPSYPMLTLILVIAAFILALRYLGHKKKIASPTGERSST